ncbi:hypothetical protein C8J57DRAFT_1581254 [Mycena rebaudengoi]|nr:hypothetical protein C8J57DRAFT_1581254 [Mycena rebaudengoi]
MRPAAHPAPEISLESDPELRKTKPKKSRSAKSAAIVEDTKPRAAKEKAKTKIGASKRGRQAPKKGITKIVAESGSEASSESEEANAQSSDTTSDSELEEDDDAASVNSKEWEEERPQVKRGVPKPIAAAKEETDDELMVDAPARVIAPVNSDDEAAAEILPSSHRRPSSVSSGMSICSEGGAVPDTDPEDLLDDEFASKAAESSASEDEPTPISAPMSEVEVESTNEITKPLLPQKKSKKDKKAKKAEKADPNIHAVELKSKPQASSKAPSVRQKKADQEKPEIRATVPIKKEAKSRRVEEMADAAPESSYHASARIAPPALGKEIGLTSQTPEIRAVVSGAIDSITRDCYIDDAYPILSSRVGYSKTHMIKAAQKLPDCAHVLRRLETDPRMSKCLSDLCMDRMSTLRSNMKKSAAGLVAGYFNFTHLNAAETKILVDDLITGHKYLYPVADQKTGRLDLTQPFRHPIFKKMIKEVVFTNNFAVRYAHLFIASRPKYPEQLEMSAPILGLSGTAIFAGLSEYQNNGTRQVLKFTEGAYENTYRYHCKTLADSRADAPTTTAKLLHAIYADVTNFSAKSVEMWRKCGRNVAEPMIIEGNMPEIPPNFCESELGVVKREIEVMRVFGGKSP